MYCNCCFLSKVYISPGFNGLRPKLEKAGSMSWKDLVCLCVVLSGVVLFLYGANYYYALIGWVGVYFVVAGLLAKLLLAVWGSSKKQSSQLESVEV